MRIIQYFKKLKKKFVRNREFSKRLEERFYAQSKKGIFSFFNSYLIKKGFYLELENKKGLIDYLSKDKREESGRRKSIENSVIEQRSYIQPEKLWKRAEEYVTYVDDVFKRMISYFNRFPKEQLKDYASLSFDYNPSKKDLKIKEHKNKLKFSFG